MKIFFHQFFVWFSSPFLCSPVFFFLKMNAKFIFESFVFKWFAFKKLLLKKKVLKKKVLKKKSLKKCYADLLKNQNERLNKKKTNANHLFFFFRSPQKKNRYRNVLIKKIKEKICHNEPCLFFFRLWKNVFIFESFVFKWFAFKKLSSIRKVMTFQFCLRKKHGWWFFFHNLLKKKN